MRRRRGGRLSTFAVGIIAIVVAVVVVYLGFTKSIPFRHHYTIAAEFRSSNNIALNSPVRIAGVNVGKVTSVEHLRKHGEGALVKMRIEKKGLPIHVDATAKIRPRIFLEGNFFVDIQPGTPEAKVMGDGGRIPENHTSTPVQLDQVLTALQSDTRTNLKTAIHEFSLGLSGAGGRGYNGSIKFWKPAYRDSAIVNTALLGTQPHDLSGFIDKFGSAAQAIDRNPEQLKSLVTDFNTTALAFARQQSALEQSVAELPRTLHAAMPALASLNRAFPPVRRLAREALPGVRSSGPTIDASLPLVRQLRLLVQRAELRGLVADLRPTVPSLGNLESASVPLYQQVRPASSCQNEVILPWSRETIQDSAFPATGPVYEEAVKSLPGLGGESRAGDANGQWQSVLASAPNFVYNSALGPIGTTNPIQGVNPPKPINADGSMRRPPLRADVACETQQVPDVQTNPGAPPQQTSASTLTSAAARARYQEAEATAIKFVQRSIKAEGLSRTLRVTPTELNASAVTRLRKVAKR